MDTLYYDFVGYVDTDKSSGEEVKVPGKKEELEHVILLSGTRPMCRSFINQGIAIIFPWPDIIALREINIRPLAMRARKGIVIAEFAFTYRWRWQGSLYSF